MSDFAIPAANTKVTHYGRYTVEMTAMRVPVPESQRAAWRMAIGDLYARLDALIEKDKKNEQNRGKEDILASAAQPGAAYGAADPADVAGGING